MSTINIILVVIAVIAALFYLSARIRAGKAVSELAKLKAAFELHKKYTEHLKQYEVIDDAKQEAAKIRSEADILLKGAESTAAEELKEARACHSTIVLWVQSRGINLYSTGHISISM